MLNVKLLESTLNGFILTGYSRI